MVEKAKCLKTVNTANLDVKVLQSWSSNDILGFCEWIHKSVPFKIDLRMKFYHHKYCCAIKSPSSSTSIPPSCLFISSPCVFPSSCLVFLSLTVSLSLPHPPPKSVLSGWAGFMSRVIKRRGDEGQRGKERWRTEGDGEREREREREAGTRMSSAFITPRWILPNIFYCTKCPFPVSRFISGL